MLGTLTCELCSGTRFFHLVAEPHLQPPMLLHPVWLHHCAHVPNWHWHGQGHPSGLSKEAFGSTKKMILFKCECAVKSAIMIQSVSTTATISCFIWWRVGMIPGKICFVLFPTHCRQADGPWPSYVMWLVLNLILDCWRCMVPAQLPLRAGHSDPTNTTRKASDRQWLIPEPHG